MRFAPIVVALAFLTSCGCAARLQQGLDSPIMEPADPSPETPDIPALPPRINLQPQAAGPQKELPAQGVVAITTDIGDDELQPVYGLIDRLVARGDKSITFLITTYGGAPDTAQTLVRRMEELNRQGIQTICVGDYHVMSAGTYILQGCQERWATKRTTFLCHEISTKGVEGRGTPEDHKRIAERLRHETEAWNEFLARRLKISLAEFTQRTTGNHEWVFGWEEALESGFIDKVIQPEDIQPAFPMEAPIDPGDLLKLLLGH